MIRYLYADELVRHKKLAQSMFRDRGIQFKRRLNWNVCLTSEGWEIDEYDRLNPLYLIWQQPDGRHGGSMRTLPTIGRTMINEHFQHLTGGVTIASPLIWECTRFCLAPDAEPGVAAALLLAGCEMGLRFGLEQAVGVFDARMPRIYGRIGWEPDVIGSCGEGRDQISVGVWTISKAARAEISARSGIPLSVAARWFEASFHAAEAPALEAVA
jgi:acyl homoserine lactone synthase